MQNPSLSYLHPLFFNDSLCPIASSGGSHQYDEMFEDEDDEEIADDDAAEATYDEYSHDFHEESQLNLSTSYIKKKSPQPKHSHHHLNHQQQQHVNPPPQQPPQIMSAANSASSSSSSGALPPAVTFGAVAAIAPLSPQSRKETSGKESSIPSTSADSYKAAATEPVESQPLQTLRENLARTMLSSQVSSKLFCNNFFKLVSAYKFACMCNLNIVGNIPRAT